MEYRIEHDSMGEVKVPADKYWAAQTERSHENFNNHFPICTSSNHYISQLKLIYLHVNYSSRKIENRINKYNILFIIINKWKN